MIRTYLAALTLVALAACEPVPAGPRPEQKEILDNARLVRVCPNGSRIYVTSPGTRYIQTIEPYKYSLEPIDSQVDLKDIC